MRIPVAEKKQKLKDQQAHCPNARSSPEKRQDLLSHQQFNLEQQKCAEEDGQSERQSFEAAAGDCRNRTSGMSAYRNAWGTSFRGRVHDLAIINFWGRRESTRLASGCSKQVL